MRHWNSMLTQHGHANRFLLNNSASIFLLSFCDIFAWHLCYGYYCLVILDMWIMQLCDSPLRYSYLHCKAYSSIFSTYMACCVMEPIPACIEWEAGKHAGLVSSHKLTHQQTLSLNSYLCLQAFKSCTNLQVCGRRLREVTHGEPAGPSPCEATLQTSESDCCPDC